MKKLGIIGGTFDPIHLAHIYIAEEAKRKLNLDKIIFMPAGSPPHKTNKRITGASLRFNMVKTAIEGKEGFEVSDYEIKKQGMSYTYETLEHFRESNREIYFITGADCLMDLEKWRGVDKIFELCKFVVFTRPGFNNLELMEQKKRVESKYKGEVIFLEVSERNISSTDIRKKIRDGEKVDKFLDKKVLKIIEEENLYRE
ncbi:nicotinate-nucleotide adenylyltransferase [Clostridium paraputrificum]|uniref:nicotinate-nucleotide adenylyltransferase n=1 Tax=Clostridium TaxID=1485 RepID=UPI003D348D01